MTLPPALPPAASSCEYFSVCGGGAPINKLAENGSFTSTRTAFCALTQMVPIDLILDAFDAVRDDEAQGLPGARRKSPMPRVALHQEE